MKKQTTKQLLEKFHFELLKTYSLNTFCSKLKSHLEMTLIKVIPTNPITEDQIIKMFLDNEPLEIKDIQDVKNSTEYIRSYFKEIIKKWNDLLNETYHSEDIAYESKVVTMLETKYLLESIANEYSLESRIVFAPNAYFAFDLVEGDNPQPIAFEKIKLTPAATKKLSDIFKINQEFFQELARLAALAIDKLIILSYSQKTYPLPAFPGNNLVAAIVIALTKTKKPMLNLDNGSHQMLLNDLTKLFGLEPMQISVKYHDLLRTRNPSKSLRDLADALDTLQKPIRNTK